MSLRVPLTAVLLLLCALPAAGVEPGVPLTDIAVAGSKRVSPSEYREAETVATEGAAPVDIALAVAGRFEGSTQVIMQINEGSESPFASRITVIRDGLLDDSLRGQRWDLVLDKSATGPWVIREVRESWRCWRGPNTAQFAATHCP